MTSKRRTPVGLSRGEDEFEFGGSPGESTSTRIARQSAKHIKLPEDPEDRRRRRPIEIRAAAKRRKSYGGGKAAACKEATYILDGDECTRDDDASPRPIPAAPITALPHLLQLRELGTSTKNWKTLLLKRLISSPSSARLDEKKQTERYACLDRLAVPIHPSSANSKWNALQYSAPTYYYDPNNRTSIVGDGYEDVIKKYKRKAWRPYTKQRIPFSYLKTPITDAILALDRSGSHLIGIGGRDLSCRLECAGRHPKLSIKFYGVPSPARLDKQVSFCALNDRDVCPLIHSVPLLLGSSSGPADENSNFSADSTMFEGFSSPAAETPVLILLADDESMGVAFLHHSNAAAWSGSAGCSASQNDDSIGTIVAFETPQTSCRIRGETRLTSSYRLSNVQFGSWGAFTTRNLLWPATLIPSTRHSDGATAPASLFCYKVPSAFVFLNNEDDGFRLSYLTTCDLSSSDVTACASTVLSKQPTRTDISVRSDVISWERILSDSATGLPADRDSDCHVNSTMLQVPCEIFVCVDALLSEILSKRQASLFQDSPYQSSSVLLMPEFYYNLVSASPDSFTLVLVVVFSNKEKQMHQAKRKVPSALGVYVELNTINQSYDELRWMQHPSASDAASMKQWCDALALNWRMRKCRVGPFCAGNKASQQLQTWVGSTHEVNTDEDLDDDVNAELWAEFIDQRNKGGKISSPKDISASSLYRHSDVVTNRAVHNAIPVKRISCRDSPIELIYG